MTRNTHTSVIRPACDLRGIAIEEIVIERVTEALKRAGQRKRASQFKTRAEGASGPNALFQIARQYVEPMVWV